MSEQITDPTDFTSRNRSENPHLNVDIFAHYQSLIKKILCKYEIPMQDWADIVQEAFVRFYKNASKVNELSIKPYLCTIAKNLALDNLRQKQRQKTDLCDNSELENLCDRSNEDDCSGSEYANLVEHLATYSQRTGNDFLVLFYIEGRSVAQIARLKNIARGSVTSQLSRQRQMFKKELPNLRALYMGP